MSLILDALRQAEHERGRDRTPDLFGPALGTPAPQPGGPGPSRWPWALAFMAVLVAAGALAWTFWLRPPAPAREPQAATPPVQAPQPTGAPLFNPPPAAAEVPKPPAPLATAPQPAPAAAAALRPEPAPATTAAAPSGPMPPAPSAAAETPLPAANELPAEVRARLPGLNITGHTYSDNPTLRTLMIDGRMFVEGQAVQPGLRVERIGPHRAVFNHQGTRFAVDY